MKLSELRSWLFELIAIILPGVIGLAIISSTLSDPQDFANLRLTSIAHVPLLFPSDSPWVNGIYLGAAGFVVGHLAQQCVFYSGWLFEKLTKRANYLHRSPPIVETVFSNRSVREYLVPQTSGFEADALGFSGAGLFDLIYSKYRVGTKEDVFIAVSSFCSGMTAVSILFVAAEVIAIIESKIFLGASVNGLVATVALLIAACLIFAWAQRTSYYLNMAYREVIGAFLYAATDAFRPARPNPDPVDPVVPKDQDE